MASHYEGDGGGDKKPRRLSILSQTAVAIKLEVPEMNMMQRLSSSFQKGTLISGPQEDSFSFAPTPPNAGGSHMGQPAHKRIISNIPRLNVPIGSGQKQQQLRPNSSTMKNSLQLSSSFKNLSNIHQVVSDPMGSNRATPANPPTQSMTKSSLSAMRNESFGGESLGWSPSMDGSILGTSTSAKRNRSRLLLSQRRWSSSNDIGCMAGGSINKIPTSCDAEGKEVLYQMAAIIHDFMMTQGYPVVTSNPREMLSKLTIKDYYKMVQTAAEVLLGKNHFNQEQDICKQISETTSLLKYGGPLNTSHLKSATAPSSLPSCLVFLCWLCTRASAITARINQLNQLNLLQQNKDGWLQFSRENMLAIFYVQRSAWNRSDEDKADILRETIEIQLESFRQRFYECFMIETEFTLEQLEAQRDEKLQELADIKAIQDPANDICIALDTVKQMLMEDIKRVEEAKDKVYNYNYRHSLWYKSAGLKLEIESRRRDIESLKIEVSKQLIDKQEEQKLLNEIESLRLQRVETLQTMLTKLTLNLEKKKQMKRNLDENLCKFMIRFGIVEICNASLLQLNLTKFTIPANPMSADKLNSWLDIADETLQKATNAVQHIIQANQESESEIEMTKRRISREIKRFKEELESLKCSQLNDTTTEMSEEDDGDKLTTSVLGCRHQEMLRRLSVDQLQTAELKRTVAQLKRSGSKLDEGCAEKAEAIVQWEKFLAEYLVNQQNMWKQVQQVLQERQKAMIAAYQEYQAVRRENLKLQERRMEIRNS